MSKDNLHFKIDTPKFLEEITNCALIEHAGILKIPLNIFRRYLIQISERAITLNDPILNKIMWDMALYDTPPVNSKEYRKKQNEIYKLAKEQKLKEKQNEKTKIAT